MALYMTTDKAAQLDCVYTRHRLKVKLAATRALSGRGRRWLEGREPRTLYERSQRKIKHILRVGRVDPSSAQSIEDRSESECTSAGE